MQSNTAILKGAFVLAMCSSGWVLAASDSVVLVMPQDADETGVTLVKQAAAPEMTSIFSSPLASAQLENYRGGFDLVTNDMKLTGTVADNSAVRVVSGNNSIADGAFTNASGFPIVIQNSGSNVLIQNATIINVQMQ